MFPSHAVFRFDLSKRKERAVKEKAPLPADAGKNRESQKTTAPAPETRMQEINHGVCLREAAGSLRFGTDALLLSEFVRPAPRKRALELGCGSGAVSLLLALRGAFREVVAVEIQPELAALARENVRLNRKEQTVRIREGDLRLFSPAELGGEFDAVLANPPYMRVGSGFASPSPARQRARHECDGGIAEFSLAAARCLRYGGRFYTVYRPDRMESFFAALRAAGLSPKRMVFAHDRPGSAAFVFLCESRKGGAEGLTLLPPLYLNGAPT